MKNSVLFALLMGLILSLAACGPAESDKDEPAVTDTVAGNEQREGMMGMGGGMMARHHATIPEEYAGLTNPIAADEASLERGGDIYVANCASCHGDGGSGDGPAATGLDPAPAPIAHSSQMLGDDYLFWRVSEGGAISPFNSAMIAWKTILDEDARWDVINYVQALGSGRVKPRQGVGGAAYDPGSEAERERAMLAEALAQELITEEEATVFSATHAFVDEQMIRNRENMSGNMDDLMSTALAELVATGELTQDQADTFASVHDRLVEAGLMQ